MPVGCLFGLLVTENMYLIGTKCVLLNKIRDFLKCANCKYIYKEYMTYGKTKDCVRIQWKLVA